MIKKLLLTLSLFLVVFSYSLAQKHDTEWKCIDENGKELFTIKANYTTSFQNGLARIYQQVWNGKEWVQGYGFVNKEGKVVIPCIYYDAQHFSDSLVTWVKTNDKKWLLIDRTGTIIPTKDYAKVSYFFEGNKGLSAVYEGEKMGFINREGKEVIPCQFRGSSSFSENRACVYPADNKEEVYGFIDRTGKMVIPVQFAQAGTSSFYQGTCRVQKKGTKTFLIDSMGNSVFKTKYSSLQNMNYGLAPVSLGNAFDKWRFINEKDELVFGGPYDYTKSFSEDGLTMIELKEKQGVIDTTGKEILPVKYESVYYDLKKDGYICGVYGDRAHPKSMYDSEKDYYLEGMKKLEMEDLIFLGSANYSDRILFVTKDKKSGFIDRTGKIIIPAKYERASSFSEGCTWVR